jgi:transcriptional regulator with XRE-family HTH domain
MPAITFAVRLRRLRETAGLTTYALAKKCGLTKQTLYRLELGDNEPTWQTVQLLAVDCNAFVDPNVRPKWNRRDQGGSSNSAWLDPVRDGGPRPPLASQTSRLPPWSPPPYIPAAGDAATAATHGGYASWQASSARPCQHGPRRGRSANAVPPPAASPVRGPGISTAAAAGDRSGLPAKHSSESSPPCLHANPVRLGHVPPRRNAAGSGRRPASRMPPGVPARSLVPDDGPGTPEYPRLAVVAISRRCVRSSVAGGWY